MPVSTRPGQPLGITPNMGGGGGTLGDGGIPPSLDLGLEELFGPKDVTTTQIIDLADWIRPTAENILRVGENLSFPGGNLAQYPFPDQRVAAMNPWQVQGARLGMTRALSDAPALSMSEALGLGTLSGQYLSPDTNPYLRQNYLNAARDMADVYRYATAPATQASALNAGQFGSAAQDQMRFMQQYSLGENLNNLAARMYGDNYSQERDRQMEQQRMVPQMIQQQFISPEYLQQLGTRFQQQKQLGMDVDYQNQFRRDQWPYQAFDIYKGALGAMPGGLGSQTTTGPNPNYSPPLASLIGLGLMGQAGQGYGGIPGGGMGTGYGMK